MADSVNGMISEEATFELISYSGDARSYIYEAYNLVRDGNYEEADKALEKADESLIKAHNMQTSLIHSEAQGKRIELNLLLVHAQDHLMSTILSKELMRNMIAMQKEINILKGSAHNKGTKD